MKLGKTALWFVVIALGVLPLFSFAEKSIDLYNASALVVNQTAGVRRQAAINALATVIVRVAGNKQVLQHPDVSNAVKNASQYLYEFSYRSTDKTITIAGAPQPATQLIMRFSQAPLEALLRNAQLPLWSSNRPDILLWTAINRGGKNYVSSESPMGEALKLAASNRGLPIVSPLLDLEDRSALSVSRLWALDEGSVRVASQRYQTDAVLAGRFIQGRKQWTGSFILLHQGKTHYFTAVGNRQAAAATSIVDQVSDYFANIYAIVPSASSDLRSVLLQVNNVNNFAFYTAVLDYLEKSKLVDNVALTTVSAEKMLVRANLNTDLERFLKSLELDKKLQRVNQDDNVSNPPLTELSVSLTQSPTVEVVDSAVEQSVVERPLEFVWQPL